MKKFFQKIIQNKKDWYTIPNILVYFRFLLIPAFCIVYFQCIIINDLHIEHFIAAGVLFLAAFTDFLDGLIARKCNMVTELGKAIDPLADKLMQFAIAVCLSITYYQYWTFFIMLGVFIVKEVTLFFTDIYLFNENKKINGAKWYGKVSTFVFFVAMGSLLLIPNLDNYPVVIYILTSVATFFLLVAYIGYIMLTVKIHRSNETNVVDYSKVKKEESSEESTPNQNNEIIDK